MAKKIKKRKAHIVLWIIAALFAISVPSCFAEGFGIGMICLLFVVVPAWIGYMVSPGRAAKIKKKADEAAKAEADAKREAEKQAKEARQREFDAKHGKIYAGVVSICESEKEEADRQRVLRALSKKDDDFDYYRVNIYPYNKPDGSHGIKVYADGDRLGDIDDDSVTKVMAVFDKIERLSLDFYVDDGEDGESQVFYVDITVQYAK